MVILTSIYCLAAGITMGVIFLFAGLFKRDQYIVKWGLISVLAGAFWPISVPGFFLYTYLDGLRK